MFARTSNIDNEKKGEGRKNSFFSRYRREKGKRREREEGSSYRTTLVFGLDEWIEKGKRRKEEKPVCSSALELLGKKKEGERREGSRDITVSLTGTGSDGEKRGGMWASPIVPLLSQTEFGKFAEKTKNYLRRKRSRKSIPSRSMGRRRKEPSCAPALGEQQRPIERKKKNLIIISSKPGKKEKKIKRRKQSAPHVRHARRRSQRKRKGRGGGRTATQFFH